MKKQLVIENAIFTFKQSLNILKFSLPLCVVLAIVFMRFPDIDLYASHLFFRSAIEGYTQGNAGFWLRDSNILWFIYASVDVLSRLALVSAIIISIVFFIKKKSPSIFCDGCNDEFIVGTIVGSQWHF